MVLSIGDELYGFGGNGQSGDASVLGQTYDVRFECSIVTRTLILVLPMIGIRLIASSVLRVFTVVGALLIHFITVTHGMIRRNLVQRAVLRVDKEQPARFKPEKLREPFFKALAQQCMLLFAHEFADYI